MDRLCLGTPSESFSFAGADRGYVDRSEHETIADRVCGEFQSATRAGGSSVPESIQVNHLRRRSLPSRIDSLHPPQPFAQWFGRRTVHVATLSLGWPFRPPRGGGAGLARHLHRPWAFRAAEGRGSTSLFGVCRGWERRWAANRTGRRRSRSESRRMVAGSLAPSEGEPGGGGCEDLGKRRLRQSAHGGRGGAREGDVAANAQDSAPDSAR
jgi:hypothetical protein